MAEFFGVSLSAESISSLFSSLFLFVISNKVDKNDILVRYSLQDSCVGRKFSLVDTFLLFEDTQMTVCANKD